MLEIGFYLWTSVVIILLVLMFRHARNCKIVLKLLAGILGWVGYIFILINMGLLDTFDFPPRVPLMIVMPAVAIILLMVFRLDARNTLLSVPLHIPVLLQSFRIIVELLIFGAVTENIFPRITTIGGLNYDILVGISALIMALGYKTGKVSLPVLKFWNILSLLILTVTVFSFMRGFYLDQWSSQVPKEKFVQFPFVLLPSLLLPTAVFLHAFSLRQIGLSQAVKQSSKVQGI